MRTIDSIFNAIQMGMSSKAIYLYLHRHSQDSWLAEGVGKPQITCNDVIRNFRKMNCLWDKDIA